MTSHKPIELVLLGDIMLGRFVDDALELDPNFDLFGDFEDVISSKPEATTLVVVTSDGSSEEAKAYTFKVKPKNAACLKRLKLGAVSLANNHIMDYGAQGLAWTLRSLESLGIAWAGAGPTAATAAAPAILVRGGLRIALFSLADQYSWWAAGDSKAGINYVDPASPSTWARVTAAMQAAREGPKGAQLVVALVHWGPNWSWQPDADVRALGRALVEAGGANIVFGHGAHHIQGVELVGEQLVPIIYGAGKFMDDYKVDSEYRNDVGCAWVVRVEGGRAVSLHGLPCHIKQVPRPGPPPARPPGGGAPPYNTRVSRAGPTEGGWAARKVLALSRELGTGAILVDALNELRLAITRPPADSATSEVQVAEEGGGASASLITQQSQHSIQRF